MLLCISKFVSLSTLHITCNYNPIFKDSFIHRFQFFPRNIAPNVLTFAGFLLTALNFIMLSYYDWDFFASTDDDRYPAIPNWFWIFASVNIFVAYTLGEKFVVFHFVIDFLSSCLLMQMELTVNKHGESDFQGRLESFSIMD